MLQKKKKTLGGLSRTDQMDGDTVLHDGKCRPDAVDDKSLDIAASRSCVDMQ